MKRCALAAFFALAVFAAGSANNSRTELAEADLSLWPIVAAEAEDAGVPGWLAYSLIDAESGWRVFAVNVNRNGTRDLGLAQLNDRSLDEFAWRYNDGRPVNPFDPATAARVALRYLAALYRATGNWEGAVAAYNCGLARYRTGNIPETTARHVARIFNQHPSNY
jgi:soluble lytic murein transglycosylase-like protein